MHDVLNAIIRLVALALALVQSVPAPRLVPAELAAPPLVDEYAGYLSAYSPGVMRRVIEVRQARAAHPPLPAALPPVDGYAAVLHCAHVGSLAELAKDDEQALVLIVDCAAPASYEWMLETPIAAEVDAALFERLGHGWVSVRILPRPADR